MTAWIPPLWPPCPLCDDFLPSGLSCPHPLMRSHQPRHNYLCESSKAAFLLDAMNGGEYFLEHPTLRGFIAVATEIVRGDGDATAKLRQLRAPYQALLSDSDWLPEDFKQPSGKTSMGHGIASLLLYRSTLKDLSLSTLVVAPGLATPVHNHLAWGLVGLYQGDQEEEEYEAHDHEPEPSFRPLNLRKKRILKKGDFYELVPPWNDVHRVRTISSEPSVSLHLLANDIGCIVRQKFDPESGRAEPFRSGWSNAPCEDR